MMVGVDGKAFARLTRKWTKLKRLSLEMVYFKPGKALNPSASPRMLESVAIKTGRFDDGELEWLIKPSADTLTKLVYNEYDGDCEEDWAWRASGLGHVSTVTEAGLIELLAGMGKLRVLKLDVPSLTLDGPNTIIGKLPYLYKLAISAVLVGKSGFHRALPALKQLVLMQPEDRAKEEDALDAVGCLRSCSLGHLKHIIYLQH